MDIVYTAKNQIVSLRAYLLNINPNAHLFTSWVMRPTNHNAIHLILYELSKGHDPVWVERVAPTQVSSLVNNRALEVHYQCLSSM